MTISNKSLSVQKEDSVQEEDENKQRLMVAQETANNLDLPDWNQMSDYLYRVYYVVALRVQALQWKGRAIERATHKVSRYERSSNTLFVQAYVSGQPGGQPSFHLRGRMQKQRATVAIDLMSNLNFLRVGEYLGMLGEEWADWRLVSLEVAEADF